MKLNLIYFAALRDLMGRSEDVITWAKAGSTVAELVNALHEKHAALEMEGVRVAVNEEFVNDDHALDEGDVVAFIPPVSGG